MEIERKWHMLHAPELPVLSRTRMSQSYLSLLPEVRIRRYENLLRGEADRFDLTIKSEGTLARDEIIKPLTAEEYDALLRMTNGLAPIVKDHRTYDYEGHELEFSVVDSDRAGGFTYAEIEFPSVEDARAFTAPDWFGEETTEQKGVRMKEYWRQTRLCPTDSSSCFFEQSGVSYESDTRTKG